jgi:hypothetical protein
MQMIRNGGHSVQKPIDLSVNPLIRTYPDEQELDTAFLNPLAIFATQRIVRIHLGPRNLLWPNQSRTYAHPRSAPELPSERTKPHRRWSQ